MLPEKDEHTGNVPPILEVPVAGDHPGGVPNGVPSGAPVGALYAKNKPGV